MSNQEQEPIHVTPESMDITGEATFVGGYVAPIAVTLFTLLWVLFQYWLIGWRDTDWQFGTLPYVPAQSALMSNYDPSVVAPGKQVALPSNAGGGDYAPR